jgi:hypothetical protein
MSQKACMPALPRQGSDILLESKKEGHLPREGGTQTNCQKSTGSPRWHSLLSVLEQLQKQRVKGNQAAHCPEYLNRWWL